ncbi:hypothetical protein IFR04_006664 [Cadophora malorum]|uniref:glucan 1,3-beta-glucosidase n=1 Tax=Cadophora malorum TaxID=108018 RepID=A0A8H7TJZ8_9HELO|nr:hypothetical protein IFR04_006664 [Cadophora malorum]
MKFIAFTSVLSLAAAVPFAGLGSTLVEDSSLENWDSSFLAELLKKIRTYRDKKKGRGSIPKASQFKDWKTFKGNGVNLGGWLAIEKGIDPDFSTKNAAAAAIDEDSFCATLGKSTSTSSASQSVMLADGFAGRQVWEPFWGNSNQNIVFNTRIYFFSQGTYAYDAPYDACYLAKSYQNATYPVFIGEWSIQDSKYNSGDVASRSLFYNSQLAAYMKFLHGGSFWNAKHFGSVVVGTDGTDQT